MAAGLLFTIVVCVASAISAGQQHAYEAHEKIAATLAAEEIMGRIVTDEYDNLPGWHGHVEAVGTMTDAHGQPLSDSFLMIGRDVQVTSEMQTLNPLNVRVAGRTVHVRAFNTGGRVLTELTRFIPEPQS